MIQNKREIDDRSMVHVYITIFCQLWIIHQQLDIGLNRWDLDSLGKIERIQSDGVPAKYFIIC